eukprot:3941455-Rhodomonas_salina.1
MLLRARSIAAVSTSGSMLLRTSTWERVVHQTEEYQDIVLREGVGRYPTCQYHDSVCQYRTQRSAYAGRYHSTAYASTPAKLAFVRTGYGIAHKRVSVPDVGHGIADADVSTGYGVGNGVGA